MRPSGTSTDAAAARRHPLVRLLLAYYGATPLFVALDYLLGVSVRIPHLDALPAAKAAYYGTSVLCAAAIAFRPRGAALVGYAESSANIATFVLTTWAAYFQLVERVASEGAVVDSPFTPNAVASLATSAAVLATSHALARARLSGRL